MKHWLARAIAVLVSAAALLPCWGARVQAQGHETRGPRPVHVRIQGQLSLGTLALLQRALREAREAGDPCLVVEIDTPGGEVSLMWQLAKALDHAPEEGVRTVAWVHDNALSAGMLVAISCERIYASERAAIGAATPVTVGFGQVRELAELDPKSASAIAAMVRAWAEDHGRSPEIALAMVDSKTEVYEVEVGGRARLMTGEEWADSRLASDPPHLLRTIASGGRPLTLTGREALALGFVDGIAGSLDEVLEKSGFVGREAYHVEPTRSEEILGRLNELSMLLLGLGLVLAFVEFKTAGFGLAGILSIACFGLLFTARYLVGLADIPHIVAAAVGVALIAVELIAMPGTLWPGILGCACLLLALVFGQLGPGFELANALDREALYGVLDDLLIGFCGALAVAWMLSRFLPETPWLRRLVLSPDPGPAMPATGARAGLVGHALTDLRPVGKVTLDSDPRTEYEARTEGPALDRGARVRVLESAGGRLLVTADEPEHPREAFGA